MPPAILTKVSDDESPSSSSSSVVSGASSTMSTSTQGNDLIRRRLALFPHRNENDDLTELTTAPIFTEKARQRIAKVSAKAPEPLFTQYGLLANRVNEYSQEGDGLLYYNVATPSSTFICGSQGSGKSHTLSCLLENCLMASDANELPRPLTGIVFHYDTFISDAGGSPCEAAFLSTHPDVSVRVLCAPTNVATIRESYARFPDIKIEQLRINETDLNTKRMMDLMAVKEGENMPLYLHVVSRILRDLRLEQQKTRSSFQYAAFKRMIKDEDLTPGQRGPLLQRLDTLESFMVKEQVHSSSRARHLRSTSGNSWTPRPGQLTIVDLSCPCVTPETACSLFNICLGLFIEQDTSVGRIIALDEAHKYMNDSAEASTLTEQLLATIRLQRHLGARIVISTQEPTVSPKLLDLCSLTIVHRFTSPDWMQTLQKHLAGTSVMPLLLESKVDGDDEDRDLAIKMQRLCVEGKIKGKGNSKGGKAIFAHIVQLRVGEALLFAPGAVLDMDEVFCARKLDDGVLKIRVRERVTTDGGRSVMAE